MFLAIQKKFWNQGLATILLEEGIEWAKVSGVLRRLQLSVQKTETRLRSTSTQKWDLSQKAYKKEEPI